MGIQPERRNRVTRDLNASNSNSDRQKLRRVSQHFPLTSCFILLTQDHYFIEYCQWYLKTISRKPLKRGIPVNSTAWQHVHANLTFSTTHSGDGFLDTHKTAFFCSWKPTDIDLRWGRGLGKVHGIFRANRICMQCWITLACSEGAV